MAAAAVPERRAAALSTAAVGLTLALSAATLASIDPWPAHLPLHLGLYVAAGMAWLGCAVAMRRALPSRTGLAAALAVALLLRAWALLGPPAHSDDVYRYLWDGRVAAHGINPYRYAPDAPALEPLRDETWARVNNRQLPTIYPPAAQLLFRITALGSAPLLAWKTLIGLADLATVAALHALGGPAMALTWLLSPLVLVELLRNAHLDGLAIALFAAGLLALRRRRAGTAGALLGLATAVKLLPALVIAGARDRGLRRAALLALFLVTLPFLGAGSHIAGSLGEYGRRWRSNDGAFALFYAGTSGLVYALGKRAPTDETHLGPITRLVTGRDRDEAYPDELAGALARLVVLALFVAVVVFTARRDDDPSLRALRVAEAGVGAFLLLTPSLHPWYCAWALPVLLADERRAWAWLWLCATAPLGHVPLVGYLAGQGWQDPIWTRLVEHLPAWLLLARGLGRPFPRDFAR